MAAVPFYATLIFRGAGNGRSFHMPVTVSDVAGAYVIAPDGNSFIQLPADQEYALTDMIISVGGTDTHFLDIYANQLATGVRIMNLASLNTTINRQFQLAPVIFKRGTLLRLVQAAT